MRVSCCQPPASSMVVAAPDTGGAVEVHEPAAAVAGGVLDDEVAVEENRLALGEQGRVAIEVVPADLHHADFVVGEIIDDVVKDVAGRNEIGVEDGDEFAGGLGKPRGEGAGLVADAVGAVDVADGIALGGPFFAGLAGDVGGVIGAVVENLNFELFQRIIDLAGGVDDALGDLVLVVHRQLNGDAGQLVKLALGLVVVVTVLQVEIDQNVAMEPIECHDREDGHVNQNYYIV